MTLEVRSPYDGRSVARIPRDDDETIDHKLTRARAAFEAFARTPLETRKQVVERALAWFRANHERVAADVTAQMGKPIVQARREVDTMLERAEHMLAICDAALAPDVLAEGPHLRRIEHRPLGVVLDVAAWNYPLLIAVNVVVPAVLAGNAVVLKHSARTPLCGRHFAEAFAGADGPEGLVQDLVATHEQTARVIRDRRVGYVAFTGSVRGGLEVYRTAAARCVDVGLELGGKDPAYVAEDADLDATVAGVVDGACYNAGQSCCAVERVYVHERIYDAFLERARALVAAYRMGDPADEATTLGPMAQTSAPAFLAGQVDEAVRRGARLLAGGASPEGMPRFFAPTLLADVPQDAAVMQEESFGPILPVARVESDEAAVARMNDGRYGLTASIWTTDRDRARRLAERIEAGTIYQNRCDVLDPALPWTGAKDSGIGSTLSRYGFWHLTRRTALHFEAAP